MLGYGGGTLLTGEYVVPGPAAAPILTEYLYCGGSENNLDGCYHIDLVGEICT